MPGRLPKRVQRELDALLVEGWELLEAVQPFTALANRMLTAVDVLVPEGTDDEHAAYYAAIGADLLANMNRLLGGDDDSMVPTGNEAIDVRASVQGGLTARGLIEARQRG